LLIPSLTASSYLKKDILLADRFKFSNIYKISLLGVISIFLKQEMLKHNFGLILKLRDLFLRFICSFSHMLLPSQDIYAASVMVPS
jgi:hypothetical protein